jgi:plastocyanin
MSKRGAAVFLVLVVTAPAMLAGTVSGRVILVQGGKDLADASNSVVWIEGAHGGSGGPTKAEMKSSSKRVLPRVVAVSRSATVEFPNADSIYHNVFSVSGGNRFDLGLYRSGASKSKKFDEPGLVRVYCNIHPQMVGFVVVVDSGFVALTGPDGSFKFKDVPAGSHLVKAWHEEAAELSQSAAVQASGDAPLLLRIDVSGTPAELHKNKYGKDYKPQAGETDDERY